MHMHACMYVPACNLYASSIALTGQPLRRLRLDVLALPPRPQVVAREVRGGLGAVLSGRHSLGIREQRTTGRQLFRPQILARRPLRTRRVSDALDLEREP